LDESCLNKNKVLKSCLKNALLSSNNFTSKHHLYKCTRQEENKKGLKEEKEWKGTAFSTKFAVNKHHAVMQFKFKSLQVIQHNTIAVWF